MNNKKHRLVDLIYRITHYRTYHAYKNAVRVSNCLLTFVIVLYLTGFFITNIRLKSMVLNSSVVLFFIYALTFYFIQAKSQVMKKESASAMKDISRSQNPSDAWHIYDGLYSDSEAETLEISFSSDRNIISNSLYLITGKKAKLPLSDHDFEELKYYLNALKTISNDDTAYYAYATLDDRLADQLTENGIELTRLDRKYTTRPARFDWAADNGRLGLGLWYYPKTFSAYLLNV